MIIIKKFIENLSKLKPIIFIDQLVYRVIEDGIIATGTQLAYFLFLSLFPFLIVLLNILTYTPLARQDVLTGIIYYLPNATQDIILGFSMDIIETSSQGLLSVAAILGIWTASSGITPVIKAINRAYDYEETRSFIVLKLISLLFTIALLILVTLVFLTLVFGEVLGNELFSLLGMTNVFRRLWPYIRIIIPLLYMVLIFALLYKFSPSSSVRHKIRFRSTLPGAIFTTLGWMTISILFSYYVNNFGRFAITYGSIVGIILLLIWLYISGVIMILGGEVNATLRYLNENGYQIHKNKSILANISNKF